MNQSLLDQGEMNSVVATCQKEASSKLINGEKNRHAFCIFAAAPEINHHHQFCSS
jgi:hypothetical protein